MERFERATIAISLVTIAATLIYIIAVHMSDSQRVVIQNPTVHLRQIDNDEPFRVTVRQPSNASIPIEASVMQPEHLPIPVKVIDK